jgi:hypothetical protein
MRWCSSTARPKSFDNRAADLICFREYASQINERSQEGCMSVGRRDDAARPLGSR